MRSSWVIISLIIISIFTTPSLILVQSLSVDSVDTDSNFINFENKNNLMNSISLSQTQYTIPKVFESSVILDGIISPSEYEISYNDALSNISFYWEHDGENLTIGIVVPSTGWVSWGAGENMNNATFIMGGISDSSLYCIDMNGIGYTLPENDTDNGGTDDIIDCASTEDTQSTTLEFIFPLDSADNLDPAFEIDSAVDMFFAFSISGSDNLSSDHGGTSGRTQTLSVLIDSVEPLPELDIDEFDKSIPFVKDSSVIVDGDITENEYSSQFTDQLSGIDVYWEHNSTEFKIGLVSPGTGWVSLGIGPNMQQSTMYMGGVENSLTYCIDLDGLEDWQHEEDGINDIVDCAASETIDETTLEFIIPLNTSDSLDTILEVQKVYQMFLGYQVSSDDITQIHTAHSEVFKVLVMPEAQSIETFITFDSETEVDFNETITFEIVLTDENRSLADVQIVFYMESQFGEVALATAITDVNGKANASYSNPHLLHLHTFGARSLETIVVESGEVFAYQSSEYNQEIMFNEKIEYDERAENLRLSRIGLIVAFWIVGLVIWGGFGYVYYQVYQIYKARNEEIIEDGKYESNSNNQGGS